MDLEYQVASLGLSKRLKKSGVEQASTFYWIDVPDVGWVLRRERSHADFDQYSAFTVAELGVLLGRNVNEVSWHRLGWRVWLDIGQEKYFTTEADARAFRLIHLLGLK